MIPNKIINREINRYAFVGILTTFINVLLFYFLINLNLDYKLSNLITLLFVKALSYYLNKQYVFKISCKTKKELLKQIIMFFLLRVLTLIIDYFGLILLIEWLGVPKLISKIFITAVVVIINYICSKKVVFVGDKNDKESIQILAKT